MIDTLDISIENLKESNFKLYQHLKINYNSKIVGGWRSAFTLLETEVTFRESDGSTTEHIRMPNVVLPSSNYKLQIKCDMKQNKITCSFSLPKLFHGHNISQCVSDPLHDLSFNALRNRETIEAQFSKLYECLMFYFRKYMQLQFPAIPVNFRTIRLDRLDICFNQWFPNENAVKQHLRHLKLLQPKYMKGDSKNLVPYETAIHYHTADYSYKIYHKGPEFKKNDAAELRKANKNLPAGEKIDIDFLQSEADLVLRYEYMFRSNYISKLYNTHLFRIKDEQWQWMKTTYNKLKSFEERTTTAIAGPQARAALDKIKKINQERDEYVFSLMDKEVLTDFGKNNFIRYLILTLRKKKHVSKHKYNLRDAITACEHFRRSMSSLLDKSRKFYFELSMFEVAAYRYDRDNSKPFLQTEEKILLGPEIIKLCTDKFLEFFYFFRVNEKDPFIVFEEKLNAWNKKQKEMIALLKPGDPRRKKYRPKDVPGMLTLYDALKKTTMKRLKKKYKMSDSTYKRRVNDLKDLDFGIHSIELMYTPPITYSRYFQVVQHKGKKFFKNSLKYFHQQYRAL